MALHFIARHGAGAAAGRALEFAGSAVRALDIEARMTLCNMATECAAMTALIAPDEITFAWLAGRRYAPATFDHPYWRELASDDGASFDADIAIEASENCPDGELGHQPGTCDRNRRGRAFWPAPRARIHRPCRRTADCRGAVDAAFIGSCTNSRLSDLRRAAALIRGRRIARSIRKALVVPGSSAVKRAAEAEGLHYLFEAAGFEWRESGCSLCFYAGGEGFAPGSRTISSTNRNFEGRQGPGIRTHIASPETVVASALAGVIADPRELAA